MAEMNHWQAELEQIVQGHPWTEESARARGFALAETASRRMLATASCFDDELWDQLGSDFERLVMQITQTWGEPTWQNPALESNKSDFFAASIDWPPPSKVVDGCAASTSIDISQRLPDAERAAVWRRDTTLVYVSLELLDNTRVRALVAGVLPEHR